MSTPETTKVVEPTISPNINRVADNNNNQNYC